MKCSIIRNDDQHPIERKVYILKDLTSEEKRRYISPLKMLLQSFAPLALNPLCSISSSQTIVIVFDGVPPLCTTNKFVPLNRPTMAGSQDGFEGSQKCVVVSKVIGDLSQALDFFFPLFIVVPSRNDWESNKWHFTSFETLFQTPLQLFEAFHCLGKYLRKT